jgi:molybdate transport system regulatory protein
MERCRPRNDPWYLFDRSNPYSLGLLPDSTMSLTKDLTEESMKISARNQLRGTMESVNTGDVMAEVVVRLTGGERIVSAITTESAKRLGLATGRQVTAIIKSTEVILGVEDER